MPPHQIRISRTVSDLPRAIKAYTSGLGMSLLWETTSNDGAFHALLGFPDAAWHLDLSLPADGTTHLAALGLDKGLIPSSAYFRDSSTGAGAGAAATPIAVPPGGMTGPPSPKLSTSPLSSTIPSNLAEPQPLGTPAALDVLFSLYIPDATEWVARCTAMGDAGWEEVEPVRQYVTVPEYTFRDPDGHRVVLMLAGWDSKAIMEVTNEMKKMSAGARSARDAVLEV